MNYFYYYPSYFNSDSLISLLLSGLFFLAGIIFFRRKELILKLFLFLGGISIAYFACSLDMFLHNWDEQYHALVAKNMMTDMFNPILYKNVLLVPPNESWTTSHVWLHKQPLFLWQMAISLKTFGINEISLRLPNIIAHGFLVLMIYDMGKLLKNDVTGIITALIFSYLKFPLVYAGGMEATDHNDYMFLFYVTASFWALFKYRHNNKIIYLILIGTFAGCAVMIKWLTGFLVIGVWGSYCLINERKQIIKVIISLLIGFIIAAPWQIYCYIKYKSHFLSEMNFNKKHIFETLEGHEGNLLFHFNEVKNLYADDNLIYLILVFSLIFFAFNKHISGFHKYVVLVSTIMVYTFFSLVKTKMPAFGSIVIPLVLLTISSTLIELMNKIKVKKLRRLVYILSISTLLVFFFRPSYFLKRHTLGFRPNEHRMQLSVYEKTIIKELRKQIKADKLIFINTQDLAIKLMFYIDCDATNDIPKKEIIEDLKSQNYKIVAFKKQLPDYIEKDKSIIKL